VHSPHQLPNPLPLFICDHVRERGGFAEPNGPRRIGFQEVKEFGERIGIEDFPLLPVIMAVSGVPVCEFLQDLLPCSIDQGKILHQ